MINNLATFGAGCFWGVEEVFRTTPGVISTTVGYEGGQMVNPTYEDVCTGRTGHAEVVQIEFDPHVITYDQLLEVFWTNHDPTQINQQGLDVGSQYRSVIFYHTEDQKLAAEKSKMILEQSGKLGKPIATAVVPAQTFYPAEDYHQQYLMKQGLKICH